MSEAKIEVCMIHSGSCHSEFARDLVAQQVPLGHEFASVLSANLWDLYVKDGKVPNVKLRDALKRVPIECEVRHGSRETNF